MKKKILFCTPLGGVSGSELLLLRIIQHAQGIDAAVYCEQNGSLQQYLPANVPFYVNPFSQAGIGAKWTKLKNVFTKQEYKRYLSFIQKNFKADYWYLNTVTMAHLTPIAEQMGVKVIAHFHELPHIIYEAVKYEHLQKLMHYATLFIGNTQTTCKKLEILGARQIALSYPFIVLEDIKTDHQTTQNLKAKLNITPDAFVWVIVGAPTFAKGIDYLPALARHFNDCHFVWIGKDTHSASFYYTQQEITHYQLTNVHFVGLQTQQYYYYLGLGDALLLLSKEESFGMVNLEALYMGKPVVAFNSGGVVEIIEDGLGLVVNSWNLTDFADAMASVKNRNFNFDFAKAQAKVSQFTASVQMPLWQSIIDQLPC